MKKVSIIIPSYNNRKSLQKCIKALEKQDYPEYEIIVIDDGSTDGTEGLFKGSDITYKRQENKGPSVARNFGVGIAKGDIICFTDADCIPSKEWLSKIVKPFDKDIAMSGGLVVNSTSKGIFGAWQDAQWRLLTSSSPYFPTNNIAVRKDIFLKLNGFDTEYKSLEDVEFCLRLSENGYKTKRVSDAIVVHEHRNTLAKMIKQQAKYGRGDALLIEKRPKQRIFSPFYVFMLPIIGVWHSLQLIKFKKKVYLPFFALISFAVFSIHFFSKTITHIKRGRLDLIPYKAYHGAL